MGAMTERQLQIILHAIGWPKDYRNHFVTREGSKDFAECEALVAAGMMTRHEKDWIHDYFIYAVTEQGRRAAAAPMKRRSRTVHLGVDIKGAMKRGDRYLGGLLIDENGRELTAAEVRTLFAREQAQGYTIFCGCDNRRADGGCAGHPAAAGVT